MPAVPDAQEPTRYATRADLRRMFGWSDATIRNREKAGAPVIYVSGRPAYPMPHFLDWAQATGGQRRREVPKRKGAA